MLIHNAVLTGSFSYAGADLSNISASADYSASLSTRTTNLETASGSFSTRLTAVSSSQQQISASLLQVSASYIALSGSYNIFSGSASTRITTVSSSQQDISSSQQQISASLLNVIATGATTGSNSFRADQSITGSLVVSSTITAQTLVVQTVTSSIVYSSGSNLFGSALGDRQTFTGSVNITGSLALAGNITSNGTAVVLGSGTSNYLPKFTAASTIGNSLVYDNATSVFINATSAPALGSPKLFVKQATANTYEGLLVASSANNNVIAIAHTGTQGIITTNYGTSGTNTSLAFGTNGAGQMTLDTSGNLGLGVTPSAWDTVSAMQFTGGSIASYSNYAMWLTSNAYYTAASGWKYVASTTAAQYLLDGNIHKWYIAPSGSANAAITFTQAMTLTAAGELLINTTSDAGDWKLQVNGSAYFTNTNSVGYTYVTIGNSGASGRSYDIGVGGNGVSSPYQNSFYVFDNVANQPRFYINSTGAATFAAATQDAIQTVVRMSGNNASSQLKALDFKLTAGTPLWTISTAATGTDAGINIMPNGSAGLSLAYSTGAATFSNRVIASNSAAGAATISTGNSNSSDDAGMSNLNFDGNRIRLGVLPSDGAYGCIGASGAANTGLAFVTHNGVGWGERMRITPAGYLKASNSSGYLNAAATYHELRTTTTDDWTAVVSSGAASPYGILIKYNTSTPNNTANFFLVGSDETSDRLRIQANGNVVNTNGSYGTISSDRRLKENITPATSKLNNLLKLNVVNFNLIGNEEKHIGFIAQEIQDIFPSFVYKNDTRKYDEDGNLISGLEDALGVKVGMEFAILTKAIQELKAELDTAKAEITELKNK